MKIKILLICCLLSTVAGCRIGASVFEGGDVISESGTRHCFEGGTCEFTVEGTLFTETFTAIPRTGFEFTKWRGGDGFLCADSTDPVCTVSMPSGTLGNAIVALDDMSYLMPEFTCVVEYCPLRPDPNWRALDEAIVALEEAKDIIEAYVATNGTGASNKHAYSINLGTLNSNMLQGLDVYPNDSSGTNVTFYITANVYKSVWGDTDYGTAAFSLSGQTNNDNSITWQCIPKAPGEPYVSNGTDAIPEPFLPLNCRG
jgi:uncharacterized repeat protein (TIGR02543 family)